MGQKLAAGSLCALLLGLVGLYVADFSGGVPFLSAETVPTPPAYAETIGTPAPIELPEVDIDTWFPEPEDGETGASDPYDPSTWQQVSRFLEYSNTPAGWAETCAVASTAAGNDRVAAPLAGALACSDVPAVTAVQQFAAGVLAAQAEVALWIRGVPGHSMAGIEARQGKLRLMCSVDVIAREGGEGSTYAQACALAMDAAYRTGDGPATFQALAEAYALAAADIAARDATTDPEAAFYSSGDEES